MQIKAVASKLGYQSARKAIVLLGATLRSTSTRLPLPPGDFQSLFARETKDRLFLMRRFEELGPIFRAWDWGRIHICIDGLERSARFLREHAKRVQIDTMDISALAPGGILRSMEGENHRKYRRMIIGALVATKSSTDTAPHEKLVEGELKALIAAANAGADPSLALRQCLEKIATGLLILEFFGASLAEDERQRLAAGFRRLGPHGLVWTIGPDQIGAYKDLREDILRLAKGGVEGLVGTIARQGSIDETMLGNIVYMIEMGRYDVGALLCWTLRYLSDQSDFVDTLHSEMTARPELAWSKGQAFVRETLRLEQSERLVRKVNEELTFDGFLFPKNARVRLCIWEAHKDPASFASPFEFRLENFHPVIPASNKYAAFGLDHHRCPFEEFTVRLCGLFICVMASKWHIAKLTDGPPTRGPHHWRPSARFAVGLTRRSEVGD